MIIEKCAVCGFEKIPDTGLPPCQHTAEEWATFCEGKQDPVQRWVPVDRPDVPEILTGIRAIRAQLHKDFPQLRGTGLLERSANAKGPLPPPPPPFPIPPKSSK